MNLGNSLPYKISTSRYIVYICLTCVLSEREITCDCSNAHIDIIYYLIKRGHQFEEFGITELRRQPYYSEFKDVSDKKQHGNSVEKKEEKKKRKGREVEENNILQKGQKSQFND